MDSITAIRNGVVSIAAQGNRLRTTEYPSGVGQHFAQTCIVMLSVSEASCPTGGEILRLRLRLTPSAGALQDGDGHLVRQFYHRAIAG